MVGFVAGIRPVIAMLLVLNPMASPLLAALPMSVPSSHSDASGSTGSAIRVVTGSPWVEFRGKPVLLIGDSITQGWMELGANFDQQSYVDALARRGINALLLWSYIGITDQVKDDRIGYDASEIWPWVQRGAKFDLLSWNEDYFRRLRALVKYADSKNVVVIITVHDGWTKTRFDGHPFNVANGGWLVNSS